MKLSTLSTAVSALALLMLIAPAACAQDGYSSYHWDWGLGAGDPHKRYHRSYRTPVHRYYQPQRDDSWRYREREVRLYADREWEKDKASYERDRERDNLHCRDRVRGLGTQWIGTPGALEAAKKDWMERVRYDAGEKWIDWANATEVQSRCGRTSIGETAGQVLYRCEIIARPCVAELKYDAGATTRDDRRQSIQEERREEKNERDERRP